jgi:hypothetical protein
LKSLALGAGLLAGACFALAPLAVAADAPRKLNVAPPEDASPRVAPDIRITRTPPDPPPISERAQWIFDLRYDKGDVYLLGVHRIDLPAPQATPRAMGRFALELFEGPTLVERVRFDFPMLGAAEVLDAGLHTRPSFERKLVTRIGVMFPATTRGTRLELWDRSTQVRWSMPWPPRETSIPAPPLDSGITTLREGGA